MTSLNSQNATYPSHRCLVCRMTGANLQLSNCKHTFHSRCIFQWPISCCEQCGTEVSTIHLLKKSHTKVANSSPFVRKGKWTKYEEDFANLFIKEFQAGAIPCKDGTSLRYALSQLLSCSPMRLSKKFQKNRLGKQTYVYQPRNRFSYKAHVKKQKKYAALQSQYYWEIQNANLNLRHIKLLEGNFWDEELVCFANNIGQSLTAAPSEHSLKLSNKSVVKINNQHKSKPGKLSNGVEFNEASTEVKLFRESNTEIDVALKKMSTYDMVSKLRVHPIVCGAEEYGGGMSSPVSSADEVNAFSDIFQTNIFFINNDAFGSSSLSDEYCSHLEF